MVSRALLPVQREFVIGTINPLSNVDGLEFVNFAVVELNKLGVYDVTIDVAKVGKH